MKKIRHYILENQQFAAKVIQQFNTSDLLKIRGQKYKKVNYPDENKMLQEWLEHRSLSFIHEEPINSKFYGRELLECILAAFDSVKDVYMMLKESLL